MARPAPERRRTFRRGLGVVSALLASTAPGACADPFGLDGPDPVPELPRALTVAEEEVIAATTDFGLRLMTEVLARDRRPNVVLSPLGASMALGMTMNGAAGATLAGMRAALGFEGMERDAINDAYRGLLDLLGGLDPKVELAIANSVWGNDAYAFRPSFFDAVREHFDAEARTVPFADPATLEAINRWVGEHTGGRIDGILDSLGPDQAMILLDAVWFDAPWTTAFDPDRTRPGPFTRVDGTQVTVDMMHLRGADVALGGTADLAAAELPYGGGAFTMIVAVPRDPDPRAAFDILRTMDRAGWDALAASPGEPRRIDGLSLPRFTVGSDALLDDPLRALGMADAFSPRADFSDLSTRGLCLDFVRQKTLIEVDEAGTRAAAVTSVGIGPRSFDGLVVDRPFIFAVRERLSGTLLFLGVVGDPARPDPGPGDVARSCGR